MVEHSAVNRRVAGSNPAGGANIELEMSVERSDTANPKIYYPERSRRAFF